MISKPARVYYVIPSRPLKKDSRNQNIHKIVNETVTGVIKMSEKSPKFRQCVSAKIRKLKDEGGRPQEQIIAIALSTCRKKFGIKRARDSVKPDYIWSDALKTYVNLND